MAGNYENRPPDLKGIDGLSTDPVDWLKTATELEVRQALRAILGAKALDYCCMQGYQHPNGIQVVKTGIINAKDGHSYNLRLHVFGGESGDPATSIHTHAWGMYSRVLDAAVKDETHKVDEDDVPHGPHQLYEAKSPILSGSSRLIKVERGVECAPDGSETHEKGSVRYMAAGVFHNATGHDPERLPITLVLNEETGENRTPLVVGTQDRGDEIVVPRRSLNPAVTAEGLRRLGLL